ncbi:hypothetical protein Syun_000726 [Stephania yunnanensis]|uniref:Uncharacterized protein n=1 Tax=Stephania yunnanensis TaxID=152371 RepID=A0AAP0LCR9_9MAGN
MEIRDFWGLTNLFSTETWTPSSTRTLPPTYSFQFIVSSGYSLCDLWLFDLISHTISVLCDLSVLFRLCDLSVLSSFVCVFGCSLCDLWFFVCDLWFYCGALEGNAEKSLPTKEEKDEVNQSSSSATRTGSNGQRTKRKKSSNIDATEQGLTAAANRLADAFAHTDCARLQKELHNIPELSREDVMHAMLLLGGEIKDANIFFHLDEDLKKDWVLLYLQRKF